MINLLVRGQEWELEKLASNLGDCYGHTNTTLVVTKFNDDHQNIH